MSAGVLAAVSLAQESTWGTAVTPTKTLAVKPGDGIQTDIDVQFNTALRGHLAKNVDAFKGKAQHSGSLETDFIPGYAGYLLKSLFGNCASALKGGESVVYNHTFTEQESKPSLTIEQAIDQAVRRYAGSIVTSLKLSQKIGEPLTAAYEILAKSNASATKITPALETIRPFNFADLLTASGFKIGATFYSQVEAMEIEYRNNVEFRHGNGATDPSIVVAKPSEIRGKADLYMDATTALEFTDYLNLTNQAMQFVWTGDAIGTSSNYKLDMTIHKAYLKAVKFPLTDDINMIKLEFEGIYDPTASKLVTTVLTNLTSAFT